MECFWTLESDAPPKNPERILPDGCVELILNFGAEFSEHCEDQCPLQPRNFLVGQMTRPIVISPTGAVQLIGIRFHPGGTSPFFGVPLHEITDQVVELGSLSSTLERELLRATSRAEWLAERIAAVEKFLTTQLLTVRQDPRGWTRTEAARADHSVSAGVPGSRAV